MLQQLTFHAQKTIPGTSILDLDPRPCSDNDHTSVLPHEMTDIEPGESPTRTFTWKSLAFLSHIKRRTNDDRFPRPLWETWFCSSLGVPMPPLIGPPQQCECNVFEYDLYGDHLLRLFFFHAHRETSVLTNELPEEWDQFRFLRTACLTNLKGSVVPVV